ncbi:hypothetical protein [Streptomyces sp. NPDC052496]|uniref:hypothetical protein n=1 Tax=Streptomyces sp. NPDC052496 TaxID=3154951 RepID=UPI003419DC5D
MPVRGPYPAFGAARAPIRAAVRRHVHHGKLHGRSERLRHPCARELVEQLPRDESFEDGVECVLDGIAARLRD